MVKKETQKLILQKSIYSNDFVEFRRSLKTPSFKFWATRSWDRAWMFHALGFYNIRRHGTWGNDVLPPPCWPCEREARIVLLRHHELDPLLPIFFSSTIFSSLHSRQSVHSAHFLQHSVQCCAHRCWVPTVTPFFFCDFLMKTFRLIYPSWIVFPLCFTHTVFFQHAPTFSLTHAIYLLIFGEYACKVSKKKKDKKKKKKKKFWVTLIINDKVRKVQRRLRCVGD